RRARARGGGAGVGQVDQRAAYGVLGEARVARFGQRGRRQLEARGADGVLLVEDRLPLVGGGHRLHAADLDDDRLFGRHGRGTADLLPRGGLQQLVQLLREAAEDLVVPQRRRGLLRLREAPLPEPVHAFGPRLHLARGLL